MLLSVNIYNNNKRRERGGEGGREALNFAGFLRRRDKYFL